MICGQPVLASVASFGEVNALQLSGRLPSHSDAMARSSLLLRCLLALAGGMAFVAPQVRLSAPVHAVAPAVLLAPSAAMAADGGAPSVVLGVGAWAVPNGFQKNMKKVNDQLNGMGYTIYLLYLL